MKKSFLYSVRCEKFGGKQKTIYVESSYEITEETDNSVLCRLLASLREATDFNIDLISVETVSRQANQEI